MYVSLAMSITLVQYVWVNNHVYQICISSTDVDEIEVNG
jgi:hypothetical protein